MKEVKWYMGDDGKLYCEITLDDGSDPTIIVLGAASVLDIVGSLIDFATEKK